MWLIPLYPIIISYQNLLIFQPTTGTTVPYLTGECSSYALFRTSVADPHHVAADPDHSDADPYTLFTLMRIRIRFSTLLRVWILYRSDVNLRSLFYRPFMALFWASTPPLLASSALYGSFSSLHPRLFDFDSDADPVPDPAFYSEADPDPQQCCRTYCKEKKKMSWREFREIFHR